jgi:hypothetical protein
VTTRQHLIASYILINEAHSEHLGRVTDLPDYESQPKEVREAYELAMQHADACLAALTRAVRASRKNPTVYPTQEQAS